MKAVNLIPSDARQGGGLPATGSLGVGHIVVVLLAVAVAFVTIYVLNSNTISDRQARIAALGQEVSQTQSAAARLAAYVQFEQLAVQRAQTVRQIAAARFDWNAALSDLARAVPPNTSLQALVGTVVPGAGVGGAGGGLQTGGLRGAGAGPAFELKGCTSSQDDVARLMSRLRAMNGVTRVTLSDSQKPQGATGAAPVASATNSGCRGDAPSFDLVVFYQPVPGAGPSGIASAATQPVSATAPAAAATPVSTSGAGK